MRDSSAATGSRPPRPLGTTGHTMDVAGFGALADSFAFANCTVRETLLEQLKEG